MCDPKITVNADEAGSGQANVKTAGLPYQLPNGISIHHKNKHETDFLYKEIFLERAYLKHGISLGSQACVFDVGANIGMFSMFVKQECAAARVYAFEPIPELYKILKLNVADYGRSVEVYNSGLSDMEGEATLTYYPDYSIMSGFHADSSEDAHMLSSSIRGQLLNSNIKRKEVSDEDIHRIVENKLGKKVEIQCPLRTLSSIFRETNIEGVDLLKIDAERSELAILGGIDEADWPKIKQIVLELHHIDQLQTVTAALESKGFKMKVEQEGNFANSNVFNCFAIR